MPMGAGFVPTTTRFHDAHDREHHWHFDQHANDGGEGGAGLEAEQSDRRRHCQLEEVRSPDQRRWAGHAPFRAKLAVQPVSESRVEIDLHEDRHGKRQDHQRLRHDLRALQAEQQHEREQQRDE